MTDSAHRPSDTGFPQRVGRYELLLPIGTGGMATVYLARAQVVPGVFREFAVKLMHPHVRSDPELASQLMQEARLAARIHHAHVVQVVEVEDDPLGVFLVLDYVEGDALSGLLNAARARNERIPPRIAGRILSDALIGLHAAHELVDDDGKPLRLVHRDFSPHNIMVGTDGLSRLTDFGIAKAAGENATTTGVLKGKVSYMAPEYALGNEPDRRADIWSAGVVLWELLSGTRLFKVKNDVAALIQLVSQPPQRIEDVVPNVPGAVAALVRDVLRPDPAVRCPDALTFCTRLTQAWVEFGGLAERLEVAEYVSRIVAPTLRKRREDISSIRARRSGGAPMPRSERAPDVAGSVPAEEGTGSPQVVPHRRRRVAIGAGGLALIAVSGALLFWMLDARWRAAEEPPVASASAAAEPPAAVRSVVVRASEPIAKLRVGRRAIELPEPAREVEVELLATELGELVVDATSSDGRMVKQTLQPGEGSLTLVFAAAADSGAQPDAARPPSTPRRPVATSSPRKQTKPKGPPGLAPTPFHK